MDNISIRHCFTETQQSMYAVDRLNAQIAELVFCPMCEVLHENNSNCQRND